MSFGRRRLRFCHPTTSDADVVVVEDHPRIARLVERALAEAGYRVQVAYDGREGLTTIQTSKPDVVVLDVLLPGMDGCNVCRRLRELRLRTPVLMLTAQDAESDRVTGLDADADDYLAKPFALEELLARIRALLRRVDGDGNDACPVLRLGDLSLDLASHEARRGEQSIELTAKEFQLLSYLMRHAGRVLTKSQLGDHVWSYEAETTSNAVETYIRYLRKKVDHGFARPFITHGSWRRLHDQGVGRNMVTKTCVRLAGWSWLVLGLILSIITATLYLAFSVAADFVGQVRQTLRAESLRRPSPPAPLSGRCFDGRGVAGPPPGRSRPVAQAGHVYRRALSTGFDCRPLAASRADRGPNPRSRE